MKAFCCSIKSMIQTAVILSIILIFPNYETSCFEDPLTQQEREWLKQYDGKITLAFETNYAPFAFIDQNGKSSGLATEYIKLIQKKLNFSLKEIKFESFNNIIESAKKNEIDIVNAVTETAIRSRYLLFTKSFIEIPNVIIVRKEKFKPLTIDKLKDLKVSTVKDYAITEYLLKNHAYLDMDLTPDDLTALLSVSFNRTDCTILDLATASYLIEQKGITNLRVAGDAGYYIKLSIASRKDWPILNQILAKGLASISVHEKESIRNKWISIDQVNFFKSGTFWGIIISITFAFLFCLFAVLIWNRTLKKLVFKRTNQLTSELKERKKAEKNAVQAEKRFRDLFESISDLIFTQDMEGRFLSANPAMQKLFGYTEEEFLEKKAAEFMKSELKSYYETDYLNMIKKLGYYDGISSYFKKDGSRIYIDYRISIVTPSGGEPYISGIGKDVTDKVKSERKMKQMEVQIIQSQKMETIGALAGGIAHDFNNILFPILGHTEMLLSDVRKDSPMHASLNKIYSGGMRAAALVKQILTFSRQGASKVKKIEMQSIVKEALNLIRSTIPTSIMIKQEIQKDPIMIKADPTQIHQVMMNLATNAYQAMEETGGELIVTLKQLEISGIIDPDMKPGEFACLTIADTGLGIESDTIKKIFDPFFTTKEPGKGTGMGLSVVHGIVKSNGGFIQVNSNPGKGSVFQVYFPLVSRPKSFDIIFGNLNFYAAIPISCSV
jgi:PAS domain S-box-containing protein